MTYQLRFVTDPAEFFKRREDGDRFIAYLCRQSTKPLLHHGVVIKDDSIVAIAEITEFLIKMARYVETDLWGSTMTDRRELFQYIILKPKYSAIFALWWVLDEIAYVSPLNKDEFKAQLKKQNEMCDYVEGKIIEYILDTCKEQKP
jgi:hypothetical protein